DLKARFPGVAITSGYRSPRKNWDLYQNAYDKYLKEGKELPESIWTSRHMFGDAVDLSYASGYSNAQNWQSLWEAAGPPKLFEWSGPRIVMNQNGKIGVYTDYSFEYIYSRGNCVHLGY
ncbi:MAG TPA: hypothetical protein DCZ93_00005, partial [Elusimicrobia bacterium]|nr:hypothetical protein [Elusimicrobiota bacterium]